MQSAPAQPQSIAGTGHRPQHIAGHSAQDLFDLARGWLSLHPVREVISGLALGWDTAIGLAALNLGLPLIAAVPCADQPRFWRPTQVLTWKHLKDRASETHILSQAYSPTCMQFRNQFMVNRADAVLALWNGKQSGGTYNCIRYAQSLGKPVINLWPELQSCP